jgi:Fic-DOC domain mobile mystery protein B
MGLILTYWPGETPLDEEEMEGMLVPTIMNRSELDEFEQLNIEHALEGFLRRRISPAKFFSEEGLRSIHKKMFGEVWSWAWEFRHTNKNIGIDKHQIAVALRELCHDALYWLEHETYPPDEFAIRFKHRLVSIHPFPNGNGRHSRMVADLIVTHIFDGQPFTWWKTLGDSARQKYIQALNDADAGDIHTLIVFAKR